jgi:vacuolar-type H+-ATPase subunit E/Vma4
LWTSATGAVAAPARSRAPPGLLPTSWKNSRTTKNQEPGSLPGDRLCGAQTQVAGRSPGPRQGTAVFVEDCSVLLSLQEKIARLRLSDQKPKTKAAKAEGMGYAILRIAKRKTGSSAAAMSRHALRETDVPNAISGAPKPEVIGGFNTTAEVMSELHKGIKLAKEKGGPQGFTKASTPVLDVLITTSPDDASRLGKAGQDDYFKRALEFLAKKFGGMSNILTAAIHRDETTPHLQVLVMPLDRETNRFSASKFIGGPVGLSQLQDQFHAEVGQVHDLMRGEKGSRSKHVPVRHLYKAMNEGADLPKFSRIPPEPDMLDRLKPGYEEKKKAREKALARNAKIREEINRQAKAARMMHPKMIEKQSDRYREATRLEALAKASQIKAAEDLKAAQEHHREAHQLAQIARNDEIETRRLAVAADKIWEKGGAAVLDKLTKHMSPELITRLAHQLGIELVAGKPLLDQMRRQGRGSTLIQCAERLDRELDNLGLHERVYSGQAQREIERERSKG